LGPWTAHSGAFSAIQDAKLNAAKVGNSTHQAIQGVDFADQMALSEPANRGITGHGANSPKPMSYQDCLRAHPGRRGRSFTAGVAAADDNDVESIDH
jgi:hypothetical protein